MRIRTGSASLVAGLSLAVALSACSGPVEPDPEGWAVAIEEVPGVTSAEVEYQEFVSGEEAVVVIATETNDEEELEGILRESVDRFLIATEGMPTFGLDYSARSEDGTIALYPEDIGWTSWTVDVLRDEAAAEARG